MSFLPNKHNYFAVLSGLHTANLSWQTRVDKPKLVCVNGTKTGGKHVCKLFASNRNVFADCFYAVHTHQLEFANTSLPTLVCRVKPALLHMAIASKNFVPIYSLLVNDYLVLFVIAEATDEYMFIGVFSYSEPDLNITFLLSSVAQLIVVAVISNVVV